MSALDTEKIIKQLSELHTVSEDDKRKFLILVREITGSDITRGFNDLRPALRTAATMFGMLWDEQVIMAREHITTQRRTTSRKVPVTTERKEFRRRCK